jgi:hypothetical protein
MLRRNRQEATVRLNRGGLIGCGIYAGIFLLLVGLEFVADPKGVAVLGQFAVLPAGILLTFSGLNRILPDDSWMSSGYFALALSLVIAYCVGWAINGIAHLQDRFEKQPPDSIDDHLPDGHQR